MRKTLAVLKTNPITHQVEKPDILLQRRDGKVLGKILYDNLRMSISGSALDEVNFDVYKMIDGKKNPLWDDIVDLKLINVVGFKRYEIKVSKTDTNDTIKNITGTSLECELARPIYDLHINDDDYFEYQSEDNMDSNGNIIPIKYYNPTDEAHSLLHLLLADKAPDWSIGHVPPYLTITNLGKKDFIPAHSFQRTFTIDGQTIYDFLVGDLAAETNTVYDFDTYNRIINIYDKFEIGEDTNTFINNRNLANSIKVEGNADSLKNCFKVIGGDDVITNYLSIVNLTGNYIWQFSDLQYNDMPEDLANAIKEYISYKDELSDEYYGGYDVLDDDCEMLRFKGSVNNLSDLDNIYQQELLNDEYQKITDWGLDRYSDAIKNQTIQSVYGNIDMDNRYIINWNNTLISTWISKTSTWDYYPEKGSIDTVFGGSSWFDSINMEVAYSPIVNTENGFIFLSKQEVNNYIETLISNGNKTESQLLQADKTGIGQIKNIIAAVNNGNGSDIPAWDVGALMHFSGRCGAIQLIQNGYYQGGEIGDYYYVKSLDQYYVSNGTEWVICGAFTRLCSAYDYMSYLTDTMMPSVSLKTTTADAQAQILQSDLLSTTVAVSNLSIYNSNSFDGITNNVVAYAKVILDSRYQIESVKEVSNYPYYNASSHVWTGKLKITRRTDENDTKTFVVSVNINDNELNFAKQKIMKALANNSMTDVDNDVLAYTTSVDMTELINYFQKYCLHSLESFYNGYQACLSVLMSLQSSSANSSVYDSLYNTYRIRLSAVEQVYHLRQAQVDEQQLLIYQITTEKNQLQNKADFKTYLNNINPTYWKLFNSYRREDTYQNDNYVSDGLTDGQIIAKCKELLDYANYQISMACQLQRTLTIDMNNLMIMKEFEPFWDKFAIYNYIRVQTDDEVLKLRLMQIDIDFNSIDQLNVSFAENISGNGNVLNDVADTIMQMNNIATSYNSTKQQVEQSQYKISQVGEWINNGLNASKVMITTSDENEVTVNNYGINLKDMSDEGNYGSFQTRLIGKGFFFTTDDWETVATALGQIYIKDSETDGHWATGLIADNVIGNLIAGQSLMITNDKGSVVIDGDTAKFTDISIHYTDSNGNYVHIGGDSSRIFSIGSNGVEQMYFNSDTNRMIFSGDVTAATITGGSINIGSGNFIVDSIGNMTANNGTLTGSVYASNGTIGGWAMDNTRIYTPSNSNIYLDSSTGTVNGATINGGKVDGATITSSGANGTTTISGGLIKSAGAGTNISSIETSYGTLSSYLQPNGLIAQDINSNGQYITTVGSNSISLQYIKFSPYTPYNTNINPLGITTSSLNISSGTVSSCNGYNDAIPNVKWVKDNMPSTSNFATKTDLNGYATTSDLNTKTNISFSETSWSGQVTYAVRSVSGTGSGTATYNTHPIGTSDERLKNINKLEDISRFYMDLEPISYRWKDGMSAYDPNQEHFGLSAQGVAKSLKLINRDENDVWLLCDDDVHESFGEDKYIPINDKVKHLFLDELHAMHIQMIQKQQKEIESLKQQNISLEGRIAILEQIVNQLSSQINQTTN